tara:strand:- start:190 stop:510 length:321 start_codon:yes stop_codon:yes gene_type:complete
MKTQVKTDLTHEELVEARIVRRGKQRDKVNNLKPGDIISIYVTLVESSFPYAKDYERELYRLIITKMRTSQIETVILLAGENISQNVGDKYVFAREGLVGSNWRMA